NLPDELIEKSEIENLTDMDSLKSANIIKHKQKLIITTDSVSDIPEEVLKQHNIMCMPYYVVTGNGRFKDNSEISQSNVIECLLQDKDSVKSVCGSLDEYERFFAQALNLGEKVLHVATSRDISFGYEVALEAAESFGDVTVFDSRQMSAGVGLVALKAAELAKFIYSPEELSRKLIQYIPQISTSFIIPDFSYVEQRRMPVKIYTKLVNSSNSHPVVRIRKGKIFFVVTYMGDYNRTIQRFIDRTLKKTDDIDDSELYIMQMELSNDRLEFIKREIEKRIHFKKIHVLPTSAAIACNSGPESFGLVFERKDK
nr:DegV family EDD domain-containing protein [Lachnospiraceae bacterium]